MRIAIIGAGNVGGGLGTGLAQAGHEVVFGVRHPDSEKTRAALKAAPGSRATRLPETFGRSPGWAPPVRYALTPVGP